MNRIRKKGQKRGKRLSQNQIKVQQLKNDQFILTLPQMWAKILEVEKGSKVTFVPGKHGGIEIIKVEEEEDEEEE